MMEKYSDSQSGVKNASFVIGRKATFRESYPQVASLAVEVKAVPMGFGQSEIYHYTLDTVPGQFTPCPNVHCCDGGFDTASFLMELISSCKTTGETGNLCAGAIKIGRYVRGECNYAFSGKATIGYSESTEQVAHFPM
jgi:hypothetical protein